LVVAGTYGLLLSANAGRDFQFVCESSLFGKTLMGSWLDPLLEVLPDGTLVSGSNAGLRVSRDRGCTFQNDWSLPFDPTFLTAPPGAMGGNGSIIDVCPSYVTGDGVLALATVYGADNKTLEHRIYRTTDGARTWKHLGTPIPVSMVRVVLTLDAAPSKPGRIYVSGSSAPDTLLLVSDDDGATWAAHTIPVGETRIEGAYIGAVSPSDPNRVYLRISRQSETDEGSVSWDDSLMVTDDGGQNFREVLRHRASLLGFALSADGSTVAAGYGDPEVAPIIVMDDEVGLYGASSSDLSFTQRVGTIPISCLRFTAEGLHVCAKELDRTGVDPSGAPDFHIGLWKGSGLPQKLTDFTPLLKLKDVRGPMPWANNQPSGCTAEWSSGDPSNPGMMSVCQRFNACTTGGETPLAAGAIQCGATTQGGAGGATNSGGGPATGGAPSTSGGAGVSGSATAGTGGGTSQAGNGGGSASTGSGCGFRVQSRSSHELVISSVLMLSVLAAANRRKRTANHA
jgi:hypothetical protein